MHPQINIKNLATADAEVTVQRYCRQIIIDFVKAVDTNLSYSLNPLVQIAEVEKENLFRWRLKFSSVYDIEAAGERIAVFLESLGMEVRRVYYGNFDSYMLDRPLQPQSFIVVAPSLNEK